MIEFKWWNCPINFCWRGCKKILLWAKLFCWSEWHQSGQKLVGLAHQLNDASKNSTLHSAHGVRCHTVHSAHQLDDAAESFASKNSAHGVQCHSAQCTMSQCTLYYVAMSECTAHDSTGQYTVQYTGQCTVQCRRQCTVQYTVHSAAHSAQCTLTVHSAECGTTVKIALSQPRHPKLWLQHAVIMWSKKQTKPLNNVNNWKIVQ